MKRGWGEYHDDRALRLAMLAGAAIGAVLGLLTANIAIVARVVP